jgi:peptidoglycan/LPS O-acetylase OafA/YrhL
LLDDPNTVATYGWLFLIGHLLGRCGALWDRIAAQRHRHLAIFLVLLAILIPDGELPFPVEHLAVWAMAWAGMLAALGYARAHVTTRRPWLARAQALAYPFYIWHQTVIVILAFALLRWDPDLGAWPRFGLLVAASFAASWALSEAVARIGPLRPFFGLSR